MLDEALLAILGVPGGSRSARLGRGRRIQVLYNPRLRRAYRIETVSPSLADEAREVDEDEHARLMARGVVRQLPSEVALQVGRDSLHDLFGRQRSKRFDSDDVAP